jgi:hypothetical protein
MDKPSGTSFHLLMGGRKVFSAARFLPCLGGFPRRFLCYNPMDLTISKDLTMEVSNENT